ncbi:MAG: hypothetical protein R2818_15440 [Flavobacteriales bacterium]
MNKEVIVPPFPLALMRPFSAGGSRGFMLDAMKTYGADSITGLLSCLFQGAAETTFYVVALYYGSVNVKNTRYTLGIMPLAEAWCASSPGSWWCSSTSDQVPTIVVLPQMTRLQSSLRSA